MSDFSIESRTVDGVAVLAPAGDLGVATASDLKTALLEALEREDAVAADLSGVSSLDLSTLQLLCSAHRYAALRNKIFSVCGCRNEAVAKTVSNAGFPRHSGCGLDAGKTCLWMEGNQ